MSYFDVHTHELKTIPSDKTILNLPWQLHQSLPLNQPFSLSVHPWYLDQYNSDCFKKELDKIENNPFFWAIGECGLDKNTDFSFDFQISLLNEQYKLAKRLNKPMIIHCVQAFDLLLQWKKDKNEVPMLVHGFVRKLPLLESLIKSGFYVSFGAALCQQRPTLHTAFAEMPINRLFLETDAQLEYSIEDIYHAASILKNIERESLEAQILDNFYHFFNFNLIP